jgi:hypothetical protein
MKPSWLAAILVVLLLPALLAVFGWLVLTAERGEPKLGPVGPVALAMAEVPDTLKTILNGDQRMKTFLPRRFKDLPAGWTFTPGADLPGYVLLSRYDGARGRQSVDLVSLKDGTVMHEWLPDADTLLADVPRTSRIASYDAWNVKHWRAIHPALTADGGIVVKDHQGPLMKLDACGSRVWTVPGRLFHHSTEPDGAGGFWVPSYIDPPAIAKVPADFVEDDIAHIGADGSVLWHRSLAQILLDHGMEYALFTAGDYNSDPTHLNDIQPVLEDGPYWKKGDLFLSLRHLSMVMLYRPSTDEIVWMKQGPWLAQHDVDIDGATTISVFDNNAYNRGQGDRVDGNNHIMRYDFATGEVTEPFDKAMAQEDVVTLFEGLHTVLPGGGMMIEEENAGRLLFFGPDGALAARFVNTGPDGEAFRMGWSRWVDQATGDRAKATWAAVTCPAP